jgi:hypothetical protein
MVGGEQTENGKPMLIKNQETRRMGYREGKCGQEMRKSPTDSGSWGSRIRSSASVMPDRMAI